MWCRRRGQKLVEPDAVFKPEKVPDSVKARKVYVLDNQDPFQVPLRQLPLKDMQAIEPKITADVLGVLTVEASVKSRNSFGGTAPKNVLAQARGWLKRLEKERKLG